MEISDLPRGLAPTFWSIWSDNSTQSVAESMGEGEAWIGGWDGVGLYEGNNKVPGYQNMTVHITTHRILLVPDTGLALQAPLSAVRQTEFYAGFMRSSAKITLNLGWAPKASSSDHGIAPSPAPTSSSVSVALPRASTPASAGSEPAPQQSTWTCGVCGFANALLHGTAVSPSSKCQLCGVAYATSRTMSPPPSRPASAAPSVMTPARAATPSSTASAPAPAPSAPPPPASGTRTPDAGGEQIPCPACTFLNHASMTTCEICGTGLPKLRKRDRTDKSADKERDKDRERESSLLASVVKKDDTVRLSFRKGGEREAYKRLKGVLSDKVWERVAAPKAHAERAGGGIDAILRNMSLDARAHDEGMQDAFRDLEVLMVRAGEMVRLAQSLSAKLTAAGGTSEEEATLVCSSLVQLGLPAPALTQDMVRDERAYLDGLARELGSLLTGSGRHTAGGGLMMQPGHGVVALDTVWGLWMRARGLALLPPLTLVTLLPILPAHTEPAIRSLVLPSGLQVLYSPRYAPAALARRIVLRMQPEQEDEDTDSDTEVGMSIIDIAAVEGLPIGLATELVDTLTASAPSDAGIVRDEQASPADGGVKFYRDILAQWPLGLVQ